jgi:flagellar hook-length control protein FliK
VHVALGPSAQVNVSFLPATSQAAQILNAGMDGLRQAMAASGLTLGQANVGGQGGGQAGHQTQPRAETFVPQQQNSGAESTAADGVSAYA